MFMGDFNIDKLDFTNPITKRLANILRYFGREWSIIVSLAIVTTLSGMVIDNNTSIPDLKVRVVNTTILVKNGQQASIISGSKPAQDYV